MKYLYVNLFNKKWGINYKKYQNGMKDMKSQNFRKFQGEYQELERVEHLFRITLHDYKEYGAFIQELLLTLEEVSCLVDFLDGSEEMFITYASIYPNEQINNVFSSLNLKFENFRGRVPVEKIGKFIEVLLRDFHWFDCTIIARDINIMISHDNFILVKPTEVTDDWVKKSLRKIISHR